MDTFLSIDNIISLFQKKSLIREFDPDCFIKKNFHHTTGSSTLSVFLPPRNSGLKQFNALRHNLIQGGSSFLGYEFKNGILSSDHELTKKLFHKIKKQAIIDISSIVSKYNIASINIVGISLGCVHGLMIANELSSITKSIHLVVPGHCLAEAMWNGIITQNLRNDFEHKGISLNRLKKLWGTLAPQNNLQNLKGNTLVTLYLSKADRVVPYYSGKALASAIKNKGLDPIIFENKKLGHYLTVLIYNYFPNYLSRKQA